jgi:hypothetical protein
MGHKTIEITFKIYRHLMPGSLSTAAKLLDHTRHEVEHASCVRINNG